MYGLEAINQANGWAMAAVGAIIVLVGLSVLSFLISQLHRIIDLFDNENKGSKSELGANKEVKMDVPKRLSNEISDLSKVYMSFTDQLGSSFYLADLYRVSQEVGLPHPYISIRDFRDSGLLIPKNKGRFSWKSTSA